MCAFILLSVSARAAALICSLAGRSGEKQTGEHCSSPDMHQSLSICSRREAIRLCFVADKSTLSGLSDVDLKIQIRVQQYTEVFHVRLSIQERIFTL